MTNWGKPEEAVRAVPVILRMEDLVSEGGREEEERERSTNVCRAS